jgi:hypothetical protein
MPNKTTIGLTCHNSRKRSDQLNAGPRGARDGSSVTSK